MKHLKTWWIFALLLFVVLSHGASAGLFGPKTQQAPAVQKYTIHDEESFKTNTKPFRYQPFNDPKLEFDILLPTDWTFEPPTRSGDRALKQNIPEDIGRFKSPMMGTSQTLITIQSIRLGREISIENWLKNYAITNGYSLQEQVTSLGNGRASMAYISVFEMNSTYTYAIAHMNGDMVVIARFEMPLFFKEPLGFLQKRTVESFRLLHTSDAPVETQKEYTLSDALRFSYPASWKIHYPDFKDGNHMSVQIHNETQAGKVDGLIRFVAVRRRAQTNMTQELGALKKYLNEFMGIEIKKMVSSSPLATNPGFLFSRYEIYQIGSRKKHLADQELRLAALGDKDWYIFVFLLTPSEIENFYTWANNTQTFDLVVKNLK